MPSKIEWTDETINPVIGCSKVSPGCKHCYAERQAVRLARFPHTKERYAGLTENGRWTGKTRFVESELEKPLRWRKPRVIFVCSMGDLFHESVPFGWVDRVLDTVRGAPRHTYVILTKRPDRMMWYFVLSRSRHTPPPLPNLWIGASIEDQPTADERVPHLLAIPGKKLLSVEPMLSGIDLWTAARSDDGRAGWAADKWSLGGGIHQIIVGCESGPGRRPTDLDDVRRLGNQCKAAGVPFGVKQLEVGGKVVSRPEGWPWELAWRGVPK